MQCATCGALSAAGSRFCGDCGTAFNLACSGCGALNPPRKGFCHQCGRPLVLSDTEPPGVRRRSDERRHLTVLFCDLVDSTGLASRLDPEDWHTIVGTYQRSVRDVVVRFGGHVAKYLGDGAMAFFGYPEAHGNDGERAVRAGLALLGALEELNQELRATHALELAARVGIHAGAVVVGVGADREADVFGDVPNVAARVQGVAPAGSVVITGAVHRLVPGRFVVEDLGPRALRGVPVSVALYRVVRPRGTLVAGPQTPFIGRRPERQLLADRWRRVCDGHGQMVVVMGEAGIGKSRLVQVLHDDVIETGGAFEWSECAGSPFYQNTPFRPVVDLLRHALALPTDAAADGPPALDALEQRLVRTGLAPASAVPVLAPLLDLAVPADRYPPLLLSPEQQRRRTFTTLTTWLFAIARMQPTVLVLEDVQWFDPSTLELVELLARDGATEPLFLLCTARPEFRPPWSTRSHHLHLPLARLDEGESRAMASEVMGNRVLPAILLEAVAARTDGVPLFIEELTKSLLENEAIVTAVAAIPETLQDSLMARLDRLGEAKAVAQIAAVLGREFSVALLRAVASMPAAELAAALDRLVDAELVYARGDGLDTRYVFKHALVQTAAYESLLKKRRRELHSHTAGALRDGFPDVAAGQPELLAHHHSEANEFEAAAAAWQQAGERAGARGAQHEAISHYQRALAMLQALPDSPVRVQQELFVQLAVVQLLWYVKGWGSAEAQQANLRARELAEQLGDPGQAFFVLLGREVAALTGGEMQVASELAEQLIDLAERTRDAAMRVWAQFSKGAVCYHRGELGSAHTHLTQAIALYDETQPPPFFVDSGVPSHAYAGLVACHTGFADRARAESDAALVLARRLGRPNDVGFALQVRCYLYLMLHDPERVAEAAAELGTLAAEHDFPLQRALATIFGSWARAETGQLTEGAGPVRAAMHQLALAKNGIARGFHLGILAQIDDRLGAHAEALRTSDDAVGAAPEDAVYRPDLLRLRADLLARSGAAVEVVEAVLRESIEVARQQGARWFWLRSATRLGTLLARAGREPEVQGLVEPVYREFTEGFDLPDLRAAAALLGAA